MIVLDKKINKSKTRVFFLKKVKRMVASQMSDTLGFSIMENLGKYLNTPLLHKRVSSATHAHHVEKMHKRVSA